MASQQTTSTGERERANRLLSMGFSSTQALLLAATRMGGRHIDLDRLRSMLDAGCSHDTAMRILL